MQLCKKQNIKTLSDPKERTKNDRFILTLPSLRKCIFTNYGCAFIL